MRYCRHKTFKAGINGYRVGWSLAGPPLMSVFCYGFKDILVDTGLSHMAPEVRAIAREKKVSRIFLTHHHEDHSGNAAAVAKECGARIFGHPLAAEKLKTPYPVLPYQKYVWGRTTPVGVDALPRTIDTPLGPMEAVHTPGHSRDHLVYYLPDQGVVFSGDLYLGDRIKFFRSDENIIQTIQSLKKVMTLDFDTLLCGHNPRVSQGKAHIQAKLEFLEEFCAGVVDLHGRGAREKEIFSHMKLKEDWFIKAFCFGNVSMINGVRSVLKHV